TRGLAFGAQSGSIGAICLVIIRNQQNELPGFPPGKPGLFLRGIEVFLLTLFYFIPLIFRS
ncbi:MAG: hypothetical protein ACTHLD_01925, partial [Chitinophaga sp.]